MLPQEKYGGDWAANGLLLGRFHRPAHHVNKVNFERRRNAKQSFQCRISHLAFNVAHHLLGKPGTRRRLIHGDAALHALLPQNFRDAGAYSLL
jgi:hypothetical protein